MDGAIQPVTSHATALGLRLPGGYSTVEDLRLRVRLTPKRASRESVRAAVTRLQQLDRDYFIAPESIAEEGAELVLTFPRADARSLSFRDVAQSWRARMVVHVPSVLGLSRFLIDCAAKRAELGVALLPLSPLYLRYTPKEELPWRAIVLPAVEVSPGAWAESDPDVWQWTPSAALLGSEGGADRYALGAALHAAFLGDLFPDVLSPRERFLRLVRGRSGMPHDLVPAILAALPSSLADEGRALARYTLDLLLPEEDLRPSVDRVIERFVELERALSGYRVAVRWEAEGKSELALATLEAFADAAPRSQVPWEAVARLRAEAGDVAGALEAGSRSLLFEGPQALRAYVRLLRWVATRDREALRGGLNKVNVLVSHVVDESLQLQLAHLEARHLGEVDAALARMSLELESDWNKMTRALLQARLAIDRGEYELGSKLCKDGYALLAGMPERGGPVGRYADAYLHLLDAIVHFAAVGKYQRPTYLSKAHEHLIAAHAEADAEGSDGARTLAASVVDWLRWLAAFGNQFPDPVFAAVAQGITSYLHGRSLSLRSPTSQAGVPAIPWYDENLIFPS